MSKKRESDEGIKKLQNTECGEDSPIGEETFSLSESIESCIREPSARIKSLADIGNAFEVDHNIPPRRYYRSGLEMVRMADVYFKEGNLESAYILYMKFMTLFLEKIRKHPNFKSVPVIDRAQNDAKLKEVLPKAEKLKMELLQLYEDEYKAFLRDQERKKQEEKKKEKKVEDVKKHPTEEATSGALDRDLRPALLRPLSQINVALRDMIVPAKLMSKFLILAIRNTEQNKETCGILAGVLQKDQLYISHLLIPKQTGGADCCSTENEEEIFAFQDEHNLITLGWIHVSGHPRAHLGRTHPGRKMVLLIVDLHTHCSYQLMMPEALAIVCSPKNQENAFFMLTPEYGLDFIANCRQTGFHPHPTDPPLYRKADHVKLEELPVEVVDLRRR